MHKRSKNFYQKTSRNYKQSQQCGRIQNRVTQIISLFNSKKHEHTLIPVVSKKVKWVRLSLAKDAKNLYNENFKPLEKEIEKDT